MSTTASGQASPSNDDELALRLSGHVGQWARAADLQRRRIHEDEAIVGRQLDAVLLAVSVRNLLRAATAVARLEVAGRSLERAMADFRTQVPDTEAIRNVLEHFDEYELGRGRLQKRGPIREYHIFYERDADGYRLHIENFVLDVDVAADACLTLAEAALEHIDWVVHTGARQRRGGPLDLGSRRQSDTDP